MRCNFPYCLYNKDSACILDEIEINAWGMCELCLLVTISEEELEERKGREREELRK